MTNIYINGIKTQVIFEKVALKNSCCEIQSKVVSEKTITNHWTMKGMGSVLD